MIGEAVTGCPLLTNLEAFPFPTQPISGQRREGLGEPVDREPAVIGSRAEAGLGRTVHRLRLAPLPRSLLIAGSLLVGHGLPPCTASGRQPRRLATSRFMNASESAAS